MGKKINELTGVSDITATSNNQLLPLADPVSGVAGKLTIQQAKTVFGTFKKLYISTGTEGSTLTISEVAGKELLSISREAAQIYEIGSAPDTTQFVFDGTHITLGLAVGGAGERFLILYKNSV